MTHHDASDFSKKHPADIQSDPAVISDINRLTKDKEIPCAVAFDVAEKTKASPREVGIALDVMNIRLIKCQLGLFGYTPQKKIVREMGEVNQDLTHAIKSAAVGTRLSCEGVWRIASQLNMPKMTVSSACESLKIKIKPCQLGAF